MNNFRSLCSPTKEHKRQLQLDHQPERGKQ